MMGELLTNVLKRSKKTMVSFELLPPLKGETIETLYHTLDPLMEFNPPYINVTYHREEVVYKQINHNLVEKKTIWKRPGTVAISAAIKYKYKVMVIPHIICGGFTREETENALIDLHFLGIRNVLALRGDPEKSAKVFVPEPGGHPYAVDLVKQIMNMNKGIYLDDEIRNAMPTKLSPGVAGYPEKHPEAPNRQSDLQYLKDKVDAGAEFIITQMFFDNRKYFRFVDECRALGITVPIIPGIKPVSMKQHLNYLPKTFSIDIPDELTHEVVKCRDNEQVRQIGVEWAIQQSRELVERGVPVVHFYTMGKSDNIREIASSVF